MNDFNEYLELTGEYGTVVEIKYPVVTLVGLPHAKLKELILFENGGLGRIFSIEREGE